MGKTASAPPIVVVFGDEDYQKSDALTRTLDALLPPPIDRTLALTEYDGTRKEDQGGPASGDVLAELATLPFLTPRRVVLIRDADSFVTAHRETLERYLTRPAPTGTLVLECRSFPRTTRLAKAVPGVGGQIIECKKLTGRALFDFVLAEGQRRGRKIDRAAAARLIDLVGPDAGRLAAEVEKLALYAVDQPAILERHVVELVGVAREEKVFAAVDAAAAGAGEQALRLWRQVLSTDPEAAFKALGGVAWKLRQWLGAHQMLASGLSISEIAPKVMAWGREQQLDATLRRLPPRALRRAVAALAELDSQAKSGTRSIETGVERLLVELAGSAR